jgi:hypothetical protein
VMLRLQGGTLGLPRPYVKPYSAKVPCQVSSSIKTSLEPSPSRPIPPRVTSWVRQVTYRPPKANAQVEDGGSSLSIHAKVPPKATTSIIKVQCPSSHVHQMWGLASIYGWAPKPLMKVQTKSSPHEYLFIGKGPAKTSKYSIQGLTSHKYHLK